LKAISAVAALSRHGANHGRDLSDFLCSRFKLAEQPPVHAEAVVLFPWWPQPYEIRVSGQLYLFAIKTALLSISFVEQTKRSENKK
jgi:hypothetical protein